MTSRLADSLHPGSWWILGLAFAISASLLQNLAWLTAISIGSLLVAAVFARSESRTVALKLYIWLAVLVVLTRLGFRIIFNLPDAASSAFLDLPAVTINLGFGAITTLLGPVSLTSLQSGLVDGVRLAAIILSVAMANTVANPKKLLKSTPAALYEVATAVVVAINLAPQLITSLQRVRRARALRGRSRGVSALAGTVIPALEDTIDSSLALAASMDARGFGRGTSIPKNQSFLLRALTLVALCAALIGIFSLLGSMPFGPAAPLSFGASVLAALTAVYVASRNRVRTRFRTQPFEAFDYLAIGLAIAVVTLSLFGGA